MIRVARTSFSVVFFTVTASLLASSSGAQITQYSDFSSYDTAVGGDHTLFLDFETDVGGVPILPGFNANGDPFFDIEGDEFSASVVYSSPSFPSTLVNIADISQGVDNEIGPYPSWDGILRWEYNAHYSATAFTGISVDLVTEVRFYNGADLVGSTTIGGGLVFQFFGFTSAVPFSRVEVEGLFYAIDAHYSTAAVTTIDFDDQLGLAGGFGGGTPFGSDYLIDIEYADLGVLFDSDGGGLFVAAPSNPVSAPNTVGATESGPTISYSVPATALFWKGDRPGAVDFVQLTLTNTTSPSSMEAYDFSGNLLGTDFGSASDTMRVDAPGQIHRIVIQQGPMAFDDFVFGGFGPVPALAVTPVFPGQVGVGNELVVTGAPPQRAVVLQVATAARTPSAGLLQQQAMPLILLTTDADGRAAFDLTLPNALSGTAVRARVLTTTGQVSPWSTNVIAPPAGGGKPTTLTQIHLEPLPPR